MSIMPMFLMSAFCVKAFNDPGVIMAAIVVGNVALLMFWPRAKRGVKP